MILQKIFDALKGLDFPIAYHHFEGTPNGVPFLVYYTTGARPVLADDENWLNVADIVVELYCTYKDMEAEADVETALASLGLVWSKSEVWIESEGLYMITYEMEAV